MPPFNETFGRQIPAPAVTPVEQADISLTPRRAEVNLTSGIGNRAIQTPRHRKAISHRRAGHLHGLADHDAGSATGNGKAATKTCRIGQDRRGIRKKARRIGAVDLRYRRAKLGKEARPLRADLPIKIDQPIGGGATGHRAQQAVKAIAEERAPLIPGAIDHIEVIAKWQAERHMVVIGKIAGIAVKQAAGTGSATTPCIRCHHALAEIDIEIAVIAI